MDIVIALMAAYAGFMLIVPVLFIWRETGRPYYTRRKGDPNLYLAEARRLFGEC